MAEINVVGIMTGTSLDACDLCWCQFSSEPQSPELRLQDYVQIPLPTALRKNTWKVVQDESKQSAKEFALLNYAWGTFYASAVSKTIRSKNWKIDLIGLHGQTVAHIPGKISWQLGYPEIMVSKLRVPVVFNFRSQDTADGFHGAPLAPLFHQQIAPVSADVVAIHNIGGISNTTLIRRKKMIMSFDTGPGNMPMDTYIYLVTKGKKKFDQNGSWASRGTVNRKLLLRLQRHPYFRLDPPKSTGRELFGATWLQDLFHNYKHLSHYDMLATLTEWVAWHIADTYLHLVRKTPKIIYFCGGGSYNGYLLKRIQSYLPNTQVTTTQQLGWHPMAVESAAFAWLAYARFHGIKFHLERITGNKKSLLLGQIFQ